MRGFERWELIVLSIGCVICGWLSYDLLTKHNDYVDTHVGVTYDCRLAEISPDYPSAVKQMCREKMHAK